MLGHEANINAIPPASSVIDTSLTYWPIHARFTTLSIDYDSDLDNIRPLCQAPEAYEASEGPQGEKGEGEMTPTKKST